MRVLILVESWVKAVDVKRRVRVVVLSERWRVRGVVVTGVREGVVGDEEEEACGLRRRGRRWAL